MKKDAYILHIESMRAIAAIMVMLFHFITFSNANEFIVKNEGVRHWSEFGAQGVEMFYIISGYVMTLSLTRKKYQWVNFGNYLWKRALRILPLYWSVIVAILALNYFLWSVLPPIKSIIANAFFLADAFPDTEWLNVVFGTLGIEVQFYILLGLIFPLFRANTLLKYGIIVLWLAAAYVTLDTYSVLQCAPFFILGMLLHDIQQRFNLFDLVVIFGILAALFWLAWYDDVAIVCFTLVLLIVFKPKWKPLVNIGEFSYSIYLTHGLFGGTILYFATHESYGNMKSPWLILIAVACSLLGSYAFYLVVEKPSIKWSKSVGFSKKK